MNLKQFFKKCPIKPQYIASRAGINYGTLRHYMAGTRQPTSEVIFQLQVAVQEIAKELLNTRVI